MNHILQSLILVMMGEAAVFLSLFIVLKIKASSLRREIKRRRDKEKGNGKV